MQRFFLLLLVLVMPAFAVESQILRIGNGIEPQDLDPQKVSGFPEYGILCSIFEGLITFHPKTLEPQPGMALNWKTSPDGLTWTFHLRSDAKWSNGDPVTANDFVYSWRRLLKPETAAPLASMANVIRNATAFNKGEIKDPALVGVEAPTTTQLVVHLTRPAPFLLQIVNHMAFFPVHQKTVEKFGTNWTKPANIVTNGAFRLTEWTTNKIIRVVKSPSYWDAKTVRLTEVQFFPGESDTSEALFKTGKLDISDVPLPKVPAWRADKSGVYFSNRANGVALYRLNVAKPPLDDVRVRKALALAVDRKQITEKVTKIGQTPLRSFIPDKLGDYSPIPKLPVDLSRIAEAQKLLKDAGYGPGKPLQVEILINKSELNSQVAEAIQFMWKKHLGVEAKINSLEWKVYLDAVQSKNFQIARTTWLMDYVDPEAYLEAWLSDNSGNDTNYKNPKFDELFHRATLESNAAKRLKVFQEAEALLLEDMPLIPLYVSEVFYLKRPEVEGYFQNIQNIHPLKNVWKRASKGS